MDGEYNVMRIKICVQWTVTILYLLLNCFVNVNKIKISGTYIGTLNYNVKTMFTMSSRESLLEPPCVCLYPLLERSDPHGGADSLGGVHVESLVHSEIEVEHVGIVLGPRELTVQLLVVVYRHLYWGDREWVSPPIEPIKCRETGTTTVLQALTIHLSRLKPSWISAEIDCYMKCIVANHGQHVYDHISL